MLRGAVGRGETLCFAPLARSISQNSSILPEEEDEKSCTESELRVSRRRSPARHEEVSAVQNVLGGQQVWDQRWAGVAPPGSSSIHKDAWRRWAIHALYPPSHPSRGLLFQECGATPESENLTLSSSGAIDQSSCTGTPLSSTISSPEGTARRGSQVLARQESGIVISGLSHCGEMQRRVAWPLFTLPWTLDGAPGCHLCFATCRSGDGDHGDTDHACFVTL